MLRAARIMLKESDTPHLDAELLLARTLECSRAYLLAHPEVEVGSDKASGYQDLLRRRQQGEPVAYLTGMREFWNLQLRVDSSVLIPRPETELLVDQALKQFPGREPRQVADLGTGSGAIALSLASQRPGWQIVATDICINALELASNNARELKLTGVEFRQASWCEGLETAHYDLIVTNPPYVAPDDRHLQQGDLRFEPMLALAARQQGYAALFAIIDQARRCLKPGGLLMLEHGCAQQHRLRNRLLELGYVEASGHRDLAGQPRMLQAVWLPERADRN